MGKLYSTFKLFRSNNNIVRDLLSDFIGGVPLFLYSLVWCVFKCGSLATRYLDLRLFWLFHSRTSEWLLCLITISITSCSPLQQPALVPFHSIKLLSQLLYTSQCHLRIVVCFSSHCLKLFENQLTCLSPSVSRCFLPYFFKKKKYMFKDNTKVPYPLQYPKQIAPNKKI